MRDPDARANLARLADRRVRGGRASRSSPTRPTFSIVIVAMIVMIMLHELGHFVTAKWSGMKVTEYFLGFGPRLWSFRRGETEYGVKALPLGGYVKIIGMSNLEEVPPEDEPRTYRQQPFRKRLLVAVAGSAVHFILALMLIFTILVGYGQQQPGTVQVQALTVMAGAGKPGARGRHRARRRNRLDQRPPGAATSNQVSDVTRVSAGTAGCPRRQARRPRQDVDARPGERPRRDSRRDSLRSRRRPRTPV